MKIKIFPLIAAVGMLSLPIGALSSKELGDRIELLVEVSGDSNACAELVSERFEGAELVYTYDTLLCGFSIELYEAQAILLGNFDFVNSFVPSGSYEALAANVDFDSLSSAPGEMIGIDSARAEGLDGSKTVVAVIDSGFDVEHTAFSIEPDDVKLSESYVKSLNDSKKLAASRYGAISGELYKSSKLPFVYDYAECDADVSSSSEHGTHVAGIIGAEKLGSRGVEGVAPKCQLLFMKIFDENSHTSDSILLAALEDAVKLGADVINLSLGRYSGSASYQMINGLDTLFARAEAMGVMIVCAAGNEAASVTSSNSPDIENDDLPPASYTDYGTISYPASADYTLSVGSIDSSAVWGEYFLFGNDRIYYNDTNRDGKVLNSTFARHFNGSFGIELVPGIGSEEDYEGLNVRGKIAVIERGETTFVEKTRIAAEHGAVGVIICNNVENETIKLELTGAAIPAISISKADGELIKSSSLRTVSFSTDYIVAEREGGRLSSYSSVGATPSLTLAPDVCGVGGGVYSSINDGYGGLSGTSMAAPQISGACALIAQKYNGELILKERVKLIREILMNTAEPLLGENGVEYSPRFQGAGLIDLENALGREVSLTYKQNGRPKAELSDLLGDLFYLELTVKNLTDCSLGLSLGVTLTSDGYILRDGLYYSTMTAEPDTLSRIRTAESGELNLYSENYEGLELTLEPGEERDITLIFEIDKELDAELSEIFTSGRFLEGYVKVSTEKAEYSLPYMGYSDDWTLPAILDPAVGNSDAVFGGSSIVTVVSGLFLDAGMNYYTDTPTKRTIAFSPNGDGTADGLWLRGELLRNVSGGWLKVYSGEEEVYSTSLYSYQTKSDGSSEAQLVMLGWDGSDGFNHAYILPDGRYRLEYTFKLDFADAEQTYSYEAIIDTEAPRIDAVSYCSEKKLLTLTVSDNETLQYVKLTDSDKDLFKLVTPTNDDCLTLELDLSGYEGDKIYIEAVDCAYNSTIERFDLGEIEIGAFEDEQ